MEKLLVSTFPCSGSERINNVCVIYNYSPTNSSHRVCV